ncbi:MAG: hypothetical protein R3277_00510 [Brumimicrobium sp.]|nr:hypothetical protein [Brumimicrobium sp.]
MWKKSFYLIAALMIITKTGVSQTSKAGIFYISFRIQDELREDLKVVFNERKFLSGFSSQPIFPEELIDSIKSDIESSVSRAIDAEAECIYKTNRKGDTVFTLGVGEELEGMPVDRKGNAISEHDKDLYVRVDVYITSKGGMSVELPDGKRSRLKPAINYVITAYDKAGKKVYKEKVKVKDFGVLKARERDSANGKRTVRKAEILYPEDIYEMLKVAITKFHETN